MQTTTRVSIGNVYQGLGKEVLITKVRENEEGISVTYHELVLSVDRQRMKELAMPGEVQVFFKAVPGDYFETLTLGDFLQKYRSAE